MYYSDILELCVARIYWNYVLHGYTGIMYNTDILELCAALRPSMLDWVRLEACHNDTMDDANDTVLGKTWDIKANKDHEWCNTVV